MRDLEQNRDMRVLTTIGSTNAVQSSAPSNKASTKDMAADPRRIRTSWSLNCCRTSLHSGVGGSSGNAIHPSQPRILLPSWSFLYRFSHMSVWRSRPHPLTNRYFRIRQNTSGSLPKTEHRRPPYLRGRSVELGLCEGRSVQKDSAVPSVLRQTSVQAKRTQMTDKQNLSQ